MDKLNQHTQRSIVDDLLAEKTLWRIYLQSRTIPFSAVNRRAGIGVFFLVSLVTSRASSLSSILDQFLMLATLTFNTAISLLGFLLAGFTFFATVADKSLFCMMAKKNDSKTGLSYLKLNLFVFMRVFVEYLVVCLLSLILAVTLVEKSASRLYVEEVLAQTLALGNPRCPIWIASAGFGFFLGVLVYLLAQLSSFIFDIYHVVVTSVSWSLEMESND